MENGLEYAPLVVILYLVLCYEIFEIVTAITHRETPQKEQQKIKQIKKPPTIKRSSSMRHFTQMRITQT